MSLLRIAWRLLQARGLHHAVTAAALALGMGLMLASAGLADAVQGAVSEMARRYPVVLGPRVGAVPLVLGSLTTLQDLEAATDEALYRRLAQDPRVEVAVPLLAGHAVSGLPLLGTSPAYLLPRERFPLQDGRSFAEGAAEAVLGARAAERLGLGVGDRIDIEHLHAGAPAEAGRLAVVGVLAPTGSDLDERVLCPLDAIHASHEAVHGDDHEEEGAEGDEEGAHGAPHEAGRLVSSVLVRPVDDAALLALQEELQADPAIEVALTGQTFRRIADRLSGGGRLLGLLVGGVVLVTFLSSLLSSYTSALAQGRDLAVLRVLGARRWQVLAVAASSGLGVTLGGALAGLGVASILGGIAERVLREELGLDATVAILAGRSPAWLALALAALLATALLPALAAYNVEAAEALSDQPGGGRTARSQLRWSMRFLVPLAVFVWAEQAMSRHGSESLSRPLDPSSAAVFEAMAGWTRGDPPAALAALAGREASLEGYMYALGDPWDVEDFYLVALDPRLPRCPFCYRAPSRHERLLVRTGGRRLELAPGLVRARGTLGLAPGERDPVVLALSDLDVVVAR